MTDENWLNENKAAGPRVYGEFIGRTGRED